MQRAKADLARIVAHLVLAVLIAVACWALLAMVVALAMGWS